jgi:hypothetical protein
MCREHHFEKMRPQKQMPWRMCPDCKKKALEIEENYNLDFMDPVSVGYY